MGSSLTEIEFELSTNIIKKVVSEIKLAKEYIRIAMFQIHNEEVFSTLLALAKKGIRIEILTLPYESINDDVRKEVEKNFEALKVEKVHLHFDKWNVGSSERTTTATNRWYSFHGKFIVTDKSAIVLSANLLKNPELDVAVVFKNDEDRIGEFNGQFDRLLNLFVNPNNGFDGVIHNQILEAQGGKDCGVFDLPKGADISHKEHWIQHYPGVICPAKVGIENKLYITPFDCRGRDILTSLVEEAEDFIYISTESFTDIDFSALLSNIAINKGNDIKILTVPKSMDFTDRVNSMLKDLLSRGVDVRASDEDLHAKLLVTDKMLEVGSINLNKINLGFDMPHKCWRENTETLLLLRDHEIIKTAKAQFLNVFSRGHPVRKELTEKLEKTAKDMFAGTFGLNSKKEAKNVFAKFMPRKTN